MQPGRVTVFDADALTALTPAQCQDAIAATAPDALVAASPGTRVRLRSTLPDRDDSVLTPGDESGRTGTAAADAADGPAVHRLGGVNVVVATSLESLRTLPVLEADGTLNPDEETYVLTDALELDVRPTELATIRDGLDAYQRAIAEGERAADRVLAGSYTHLSTGLPAGYHGEWEGLTVRGAAPSELDGAPDGGNAGEAAVVALRLGPGGVVASERLRQDSLGLRAIDGVGEQHARTLRDAGYPDRESLATADVATIADRDGIGRSTAARLVDRATAFEDGAVLRRTDERLPGTDPIFLDVETDGLSPSVVWLIGVLDRADDGATAGEDHTSDGYRSFLATDPDRPGEAVEAFCEWYAEHGDGRPIAAYNGQSFDVPVLAEQIERRRPEFGDLWANAWTVDPYAWAVRDGNAVLPGRTNRLEDVAGALGFDASPDADPDAPTGPLSGAEVARIYRTWQADPSPATEPDWDRLDAYCESDVRALAHVYDAIEAADRIDGQRRGEHERDRAPQTTQGSLGDF